MVISELEIAVLNVHVFEDDHVFYLGPTRREHTHLLRQSLRCGLERLLGSSSVFELTFTYGRFEVERLERANNSSSHNCCRALPRTRQSRRPRAQPPVPCSLFDAGQTRDRQTSLARHD
ncbi:hypothetical protein C8Q80DRAFT_48014 [Daedaleopsis nitida]|nr:hypothetical protein C8Q80DRAFT_48014 [Daedaleopsis nitida]